MTEFTPGSPGSPNTNMPFTNMLLNAEQFQRENNPDQPVERPAMVQFIMDQESAVATDFTEGRISEKEFNDFKELSQERADATREGIRDAFEPFVEDINSWKDETSSSIGSFMEEHGAEAEKLAKVSDEQAVTRFEVSLGLAADTLGLTVESADALLERLPPHLHDIMNSLEEGVNGSAHDLLAARGELGSAGEHDLDAESDRLEILAPAFEAEFEAARESMDVAFERIDQQFDDARDVVDAIRDYADAHPDVTIEVVVERTIEDPNLEDRIEDDTGVTSA